jgi:prepilin-type processing-associated H-X9-DG protein
MGRNIDGTYITGGFRSLHPGGCNFGFGDGHVAFLSDNIDIYTYQALSTRDTGEPIARERD